MAIALSDLVAIHHCIGDNQVLYLVIAGDHYVKLRNCETHNIDCMVKVLVCSGACVFGYSSVGSWPLGWATWWWCGKEGHMGQKYVVQNSWG